MNELLKFLTKELLQVLLMSSEERQKRKMQKKEERLSWRTYWFGTLPIAIGMVVRRTWVRPNLWRKRSS